MLILMLGGTMTQAQPKERIEAWKIAYITKNLDLSPAEAEKFWPLYNAYKGEVEEIQKRKNTIRRGNRRVLQSKSDTELEQLADEYINLSVKQAEVQSYYHQELKKILPIQKVVLFYKTEQELNRKILEEIRRRQEERMNNRNRPRN